MTSSTGQITSATNYAPYGNVLNSFSTYDTSLGFTGEYSDPTGLLYLRARYYNSSMGTFMSKDPFRGVMSRVASRNGYSWVEGRVINATDPSGMAIVDIWVAAFIAPSSITFPYYEAPGSLDPRDVLRSVDTNAVWHGDGRGFYSGGQPRSYHPSSRVWHQVSFDTEYPVAAIAQGSSSTHVRYTDFHGWPSYRRGKVDPPPPATITRSNSHISVVIEAHAANPLISIAPKIDYWYRFDFNLTTGQILVYGYHDVFPWHEVVVQIDGNLSFAYHASPSGLTKTPGDLVMSVQPFIIDVVDPNLIGDCDTPIP